MKTRIGLVGILALVTGCVSTGAFLQLPSAEQDLFQRCSRTMQPVLCGDDKDQVYVTMCIRSNMAKYSEQQTPQARQAWLIGRGCPPPMVQPEKYASAAVPR